MNEYNLKQMQVALEKQYPPFENDGSVALHPKELAEKYPEIFDIREVRRAGDYAFHRSAEELSQKISTRAFAHGKDTLSNKWKKKPLIQRLRDAWNGEINSKQQNTAPARENTQTLEI